MRISIGIPTRGRPEILQHAVDRALSQTRPPDRIVIAYSDTTDVGDDLRAHSGIVLLQTGAGLCHQRNRILDTIATEDDVVLFLDDDFFLHRKYLRELEQVFEQWEELVVATGTVIADGIKGPGLTPSDANSILAGLEVTPLLRRRELSAAFNAYGCNMALRLAPIREHNLRFDEALPLYAWYEDIDMSRRLAKYGQVMTISTAYGVHLGTKRGRISGLRLGYSQVANPLYLMRKGIYPLTDAGSSIGRNMAANLMRSVHPEAYVDRRGRLCGNLTAMLDLLRGRLNPSRILELRG